MGVRGAEPAWIGLGSRTEQRKAEEPARSPGRNRRRGTDAGLFIPGVPMNSMSRTNSTVAMSRTNSVNNAGQAPPPPPKQRRGKPRKQMQEQ